MDEFKTSRRYLLQGAAITAAVGFTAPALAQSATPGAAPAAAPLRNPQGGFPKPPFTEQSQPWPGLASKMDPRPDHGEDSYEGSGQLAGRRALITGGDSGIGRAVAIAFAREGADVAINYLPAEEADAQEVVKLIRGAGRKAVAIPGDLRDPDFCRNLVQQANTALGGLDILISNAGRQHSYDSILDIPDEQFDWTVKTNLYAMFWVTKAAVAVMPEGAAIVYTASVNAYDPSRNLLDYAMTKAGIANFSKCLAKQLADRGIRVNAVAPGPFWTPLQVSGGQTMDKLKSFGSDTPLKRPGQPAEIAGLYVQLASAKSTYVTGQVFGASGGAGQP
ncbi:SDR family oxidoreductase [Pseudomonas silvicola]|nr:SDR family oxidoreductase [Pseudomonas silvicola]